MERFWKTTLILCVIYLATSMIISPTKCVASAQSAIYLCIDVVIPSLFPFFICSNLFISLGVTRIIGNRLSTLMKPLFGVSGSGALAVLLGILSGYPVGASCVAELYSTGNCSKTEAERLLAFCNNSGPLFVLGSIGIGILENQILGILLYLIHIVSALLTGILFKNYGKTEYSYSVKALPPSTPADKDILSAIGTAVSNSIASISKVCGFVILFAVFCAALPEQSYTPIVYSLLEITGGIKALVNSAILPDLIILPLVSLFLALSGVSVLLQTAAILNPVGLSIKTYIFGKCVQGIISFVLTFLFLKMLPISSHVFSGMPLPYHIPTPNALIYSALICTLTVGISIALLSLILWLEELWSQFKNKKSLHHQEKS